MRQPKVSLLDKVISTFDDPYLDKSYQVYKELTQESLQLDFSNYKLAIEGKFTDLQVLVFLVKTHVITEKDYSNTCREYLLSKVV